MSENKPVHADVGEYSQSTIDGQPKRLTSRHRTLMRKLLAGKKMGEAADELGYSIQRASIVVNSPLFVDEMQRMQEQINEGTIRVESEKVHYDGGIKAAMEEEAHESLRTLINLRDGSGSDRVKQVSALEILDRAGYGKTDKLEATVSLDASDGLTAALQVAIKEMRCGNTESGKDSNDGDAG